MVPLLHLGLLGPWRAELNGAPLAGLPTRHARALLARLALAHPRSLTRAQLCADLFPDIPTENAARSLRTTLYYLRRALFDYLRTDHEHVTLEPGLQVVHDVGAFERRVALGATPVELQQAIELYRGPFLEANLEGWAMSEALRLHSTYIDALRVLVTMADEQGDIDTVAAVAQRWAKEEPWKYEAHRALIGALLAQGDRAATERAIGTARGHIRHTQNESYRLEFDTWARTAARLTTAKLQPAKAQDGPVQSDMSADEHVREFDALLGTSERTWADVLGDAIAAGEKALDENRLVTVERALRVAEQASAALNLPPYDRWRWLLLRLRAGYYASAGPRSASVAALDTLDAFARSSGRPNWRADALIRRAQALRVQGQLRGAEEAAREASRIARSSGFLYHEGRAQRVLAFVLDQQIRPVDEALRAWQAAAEATATTPDDPLYLEAQLNIAQAQVRLHQPHAARALIDSLLAAPALTQQPRLSALAPRYLGLVEYGLRNYEGAISSMRESVRRLQVLGGQYAEIVSRRWLVDMLTGLGQLEAARALGELNIDRARHLGVHRVEWEGLWTLANIALWEGDAEDAHRLAEESLSLAESYGSSGNLVKILGIVIESAVASGNLSEAHSALRRMQRLAGNVERSVFLRAIPVDVVMHIDEPVVAALLARDVLQAHDVILGMPIEHTPVQGLRSFWNATTVLRAFEGNAAARPFCEQACARIVEDVAILTSATSRKMFLGATATQRDLAAFQTTGPRRLVLLPLRAAPSGRPLHADELMPVVWTIHAPEDPVEPLALRRAQIERLTMEAAAQGAIATVEALADVLNVGTRTIQRDLQALRRAGVGVHTRGHFAEP